MTPRKRLVTLSIFPGGVFLGCFSCFLTVLTLMLLLQFSSWVPKRGTLHPVRTIFLRADSSTLSPCTPVRPFSCILLFLVDHTMHYATAPLCASRRVFSWNDQPLFDATVCDRIVPKILRCSVNGFPSCSCRTPTLALRSIPQHIFLFSTAHI